MDDVFTFRNRLIGEYSSFSRSFSKVAAPDILVKVEAEYARGRYWPEPLIQINPNYKRSGSAANAAASLMLFGEWCAARHSLGYDRLPDWFLLFDVYDRSQARFWSAPRRNALAATLGLVTVPRLLVGRFTLPQLKDALVGQHSQFRQGALESIVIRRESAEWCEARAELVRPDFTQAIGEHWSRRRIEWNRLGRSHENLN